MDIKILKLKTKILMRLTTRIKLLQIFTITGANPNPSRDVQGTTTSPHERTKTYGSIYGCIYGCT